MLEKLQRALKEPIIVKHWLLDRYYQYLSTYIPENPRAAYCQRVALSVNSSCNLKCKMCDIGLKNERGEFYKNVHNGDKLSIATLRRLVSDIKTFHPMISINGTEPLLYDDLDTLVALLVQNSIPCELTTNGFLLEKRAEGLVSSGLPRINISLHGPEEIHNDVVGVSNSFQRSLRGIEKIIALKEELGINYPEINIACTISQINTDRLYGLVEHCQELGVDRITLTHLNFVTSDMADGHNCLLGDYYTVRPSSVGFFNPHEVNISSLTMQIHQIRATYSEPFIQFSPNLSQYSDLYDYYMKPERFIGKSRCSIPWRNAQILSNGDVIPASRCFHIVMGNINENSFPQIWYGDRFKKFRKVMSKIGATPACSRCCGIF